MTITIIKIFDKQNQFLKIKNKLLQKVIYNLMFKQENGDSSINNLSRNLLWSILINILCLNDNLICLDRTGTIDCFTGRLIECF